MQGDRLVGGLWCHEVLEALSTYLDGTLDGPARAQVGAHLAGCDVCARFGGEVGRTVRALRERLGQAEPLAEGVSGRLRARLDAELPGR